MPEYRRTFIEGGTYFFTVVTYNRFAILTTEEGRNFLHEAWLEVCERLPFETVAVCILPDHLHCIWTLPEGDANFSGRWKEIKRVFTRRYLEQVGPGRVVSASRIKHGEAAVWQRRFWEHAIRDEEDFCRHLDYIHYNPVKHGLVQRVSDWPYSSFHRYVKRGWYNPDWGSS